MPFNNNRIYIFVVLVVIAVIFVAAIANYQPSKPKTTVGIAEVTINAQIGVEQIYVINLNTGGENIKTYMDLPYSFNVTTGQTVQISAYTKADYAFVTWEFNSGTYAGTFQDDNPLTLKVNSDVTVTATVIVDRNSGGIE